MFCTFILLFIYIQLLEFCINSQLFANFRKTILLYKIIFFLKQPIEKISSDKMIDKKLRLNGI